MSIGPNGIWYLALLLPVVAILGWWYYRYTVPDVSPLRRRVLLALRLLGLVALALALARPVFTWESKTQEAPRWVRLVDYSSSMDRDDGLTAGETRLASAERIASDPVWNEGDRRADVTTVYFGEGSAADSTQVGRTGTDLHAALTKLAEEPYPPAAVFILSDGATNAPANPTEAPWPFKIYSLCIGDSGRAADRALTGIDAPAVATAGDSVLVSVRMTASGAPEKAILTYRANREEQHRTVELDGGGRAQETTFGFVPDTAGIYKVTADLATADGEIATANNHIETRVYVEPRKHRALLLAVSPDWESAFLARRLAKNDRLELEVAYQALAGQHGYKPWPQSFDSLSAYDLVIVADMPPARWLGISANLERHLRDDAAGVLFLLGSKAARGEWSDAQQRLVQIQWSAQPPGVYLVTAPVYLSAVGRYHPVSTLDTTAERAAQLWTGLPLLTGVIPSVPAAGAVALVENDFGVQSWPVVVSGRFGRGRVLTITGYPVWRWDFATAANEEEAGWAPAFWHAATRWLTLADQGGQMTVTPAADPVPALTPPQLSAMVLDESWQPLRSAVVTAELRDSTGAVVQTIELQPEQPGRYSGSGRPLPPGDYTYSVRARVDTTEIAATEGRLSVTAVTREELFPASRPDVLDRLASETGGKRLSPDDWSTMLAGFPGSSEQRVSYGSFRLWESPWFLLVVLLLFSVEWILRRRFQML